MSHALAHSRPPLQIRPARGSDAGELSRFLRSLSARSRQWRFHGGVNAGAPELAQALVAADGVRQVVLLAVLACDDGDHVVGEARYVRSGPRADFAIAVADAQQGLGVAGALIEALAQHAGAAGVRELGGDVRADNARMLAFAQRHGFAPELRFSGIGGGADLRVSRPLQPAATGWRLLHRWWQGRLSALAVGV